MSLREVAVTNPATETRRKLRRVVISQEAIEAHWVVQQPDGTRKEHQVEVSPALRTTVFGRASFQTFINNVRDDTINRVL